MNTPLSKQKLLFTLLLSSTELLVKCSSILKPEYFDPTLKKAVTFTLDYLHKYRATPTILQLHAETGYDAELVDTLTRDQVAYATDEVEKFCQHEAVVSAIIAAMSKAGEQDYGAIVEDMKAAVSVGLIKDTGIEYFIDVMQRLQAELENPTKLSTGWTEVDDLLDGGPGRQELLLFAANSGGGKSLVKANLGLNLVKQGYNGVYISLEMAGSVVDKRFHQMLAGIGSGDILKKMSEVASKVEAYGKDAGRFFIKRLPESTTNANNIRAYLKELEQTHNFRPDFVIVDYLDLMSPVRKVAVDNLFIKDKYVAEEVRAIGTEYDCLMISSSQLGRSALEANIIGQQHIQGGISKINTCDAFIGILLTDQLKSLGEIMFHFGKTRNSSGVGKVCTLKFDPISLRISNLDTSPKGFTRVSKESKKLTEELQFNTPSLFKKNMGDELSVLDKFR